MKNLEQIIENSKRKICSSYFKIIVKDDNKLEIVQYDGLKKSFEEMLRHGWTRHDYLVNTIDQTNPVFNINDYKAVDKFTIIRKTDDDYLENELTEIVALFDLSSDLYNIVKNIKSFIAAFKVDFLKYETMNDLKAVLTEVINGWDLNINEKTNYIVSFDDSLNQLYDEMKKVKVSNPEELFNEKFKYFFIMIK